MTKKRYNVLPFIKHFAPKAIRDMLDMDYINKLSKKDRKFLNQFLSEYYFNFFREKEGLHDKAGIPRKDLYDSTNSRNRDIWHQAARFEVTSEATYDYVTQNRDRNPVNSNENAVIDYLDTKRPIDKKRKK